MKPQISTKRPKILQTLPARLSRRYPAIEDASLSFILTSSILSPVISILSTLPEKQVISQITRKVVLWFKRNRIESQYRHGRWYCEDVLRPNEWSHLLDPGVGVYQTETVMYVTFAEDSDTCNDCHSTASSVVRFHSCHSEIMN